MTALQSRQVIDDVSLGIWRASSPELVPPNGLWDLRNGLLNLDGTAYKRGGTRYRSNAGFGGSLRAIWDLVMEPGQRTIFASPDDFGVLGVDDATPINLGGPGAQAPISAAYLLGLLFLAPGYIYGGSRKTTGYTPGSNVNVTNGSDQVTGGTAFTANVDPGMLWHATPGSERFYVVKSVESNASLTLTDPYEGTTRSTASAFEHLHQITGSTYKTSAIYCVHANRLLVADANIVRFSDIGKPHSWPAFNYHALPEGVQITGLESIGSVVLVFTNAGIWTLLGMALDIVDPEGNPNHSLQVFSRDLTVFSSTGIGSWRGVLVVPCIDGVYLIDGVSQPRRISRSIQPIYERYVESGLRTGQAIVYNSHYFLPICYADGTMRDLLVAYLDRPSSYRSQTVYPWSRIDGYAAMPAYAIRTSVGGIPPEPKLLGASASNGRVVECQTILHPGYGNEHDADGTVPTWDAITRELGTGALTRNVVRVIKSHYELVGAGEPRITLSYSLGETRADVPLWNHSTWDEFDWAGSEVDTSFHDLPCELPPSAGVVPKRCRVGKKARYIRFRYRGADPTAVAALREAEVFTRPAGSVRR